MLPSGEEGSGEIAGIGLFCSEYGLYQEQQQQQELFSDCGLLDDLRFDMASPPIQACFQEMAKFDGIQYDTQDVVEEPQKKKKFPVSLASLELLNSRGNRFKRLTGKKITEPSNNIKRERFNSRNMSTEEIMRFAAARFIQTASQDGLTMLDDLSFSGLSQEETKDVVLVEFLLASTEKVGHQLYASATRLLNQCDHLSSNTGNPVERVVYYFSEALRERVDREIGRETSKGLGKKQSFDFIEAMTCPNPATLACHKEMPFAKIAQLAGIQAIIENVSKANKIHIIDLGIMNGVQWTILMQALASQPECPVELLKITAVGTTAKQLIEQTGKRLISFAQSLNLSFAFKIVMVQDMIDLKQELFQLDPEETIAIYAQFLLRSMLSLPNLLDAMMRAIRNMNPSVMVVIEVEANHNSQSFAKRFVETLFYHSAFFDCLDACMERDDPNRLIMESIYFGQGIRNIVAAEGEERNIRNVKIDVWRSFFARFGMVEEELSKSSLYQAELVLKKYACRGSFTLDMNEKSLLVGWKGTPLMSISVWKIIQPEEQEVKT